MKKANIVLILEGNRLFVSSVGNHAVSVKIDVTPVWDFFKEVMAHETMFDHTVETFVETIQQPEKDDLYERVKDYVQALATGEIITAREIGRDFEISYVRASALIDQLEGAGIIQRKDGKGPYRVV